MFAKIDTDGSGSIDLNEFDAQIHKHAVERQGRETVIILGAELGKARPFMREGGVEPDKMPKLSNLEAWKKYDSKAFEKTEGTQIKNDESKREAKNS